MQNELLACVNNSKSEYNLNGFYDKFAIPLNEETRQKLLHAVSDRATLFIDIKLNLDSNGVVQNITLTRPLTDNSIQYEGFHRVFEEEN